MMLTLCFGKRVEMEVGSIMLDEWTSVTVLDEMAEDEIEDEVAHRKHIEKIFSQIPTKLIMDRTSVDIEGDVSMENFITKEEFQLYDIGLVEGSMTDIVIPDTNPKPYISTCSECNAPSKNSAEGHCRYCGRAYRNRFSLSMNALMTDRIHLRVDHGTVEKIFRRNNERAMILVGNETYAEAKRVLLRKEKSQFLCFCYGVEEVEGIKHVYLDAVGVDRRTGKLRHTYDVQWHMMDL
jgi:hypothetical protein